MGVLSRYCFVVGSLSILGLGCGGGGDGTSAADGSVAVVEGAEVHKTVVAAEGADLEASTGHLLTIPAEALDADTTIELRPLDVSSGRLRVWAFGAAAGPHSVSAGLDTVGAEEQCSWRPGPGAELNDLGMLSAMS